ncbi:DUF5723 family protein [Flavobacterium sp. UMI-01]|uniref:DUF5723 family protein n=1 Tax=Flavobacterium sp. UMI-01 TaxID=1441053 RepID=UPI002103F849|nr:DUF5723 family protein [Flavobacterium sp. UMI-01]
MKKQLLFVFGLCALGMSAQDHFSGLKNSNKIGIFSASRNPAELSNLGSKYDINLFSVSMNVSNNKVGFQDLIKSDNDLEELIFSGNEAINLRIDSEIYGPGFALRLNKWAFGVSTKAYIKANFVDIDAQLGKAIIDGNEDAIVSSVALKSDYNQRMNATTWGELGFTAARTLFENEKHKFNGGAAIKLLFPGSYANFGIDKFQGTIDYAATTAYLNDINTNLNIAYSGNLTGDFSDTDNYTKSVFGKLNGVALDFGANYQLKDNDNGYKLNAGVAVKNMGSMTFKDPENSSTNYAFVIPDGTVLNPGLDLSLFEDVESLEDAETVLKEKDYLTEKKAESNIKVKLPTVFSAYADIKIIPKLYVSLFTQQKLGNDNDNDQITTQNVVSITPRFSLNNFEIFSPWASNEISGTTGGFGLRFYGFYLGSSSIVTALANDSKQADFYIGYRLALR